MSSCSEDKAMTASRSIYIVTAGTYSDYYIIGVFSEEDTAGKFAALNDDAQVEIYEIDAMATMAERGLRYFSITMGSKGSVHNIYQGCFGHEGFGNHEKFTTRDGERLLLKEVWATNCEHAVKIVNERRVQLLAQNRWGLPHIISAISP